MGEERARPEGIEVPSRWRAEAGSAACQGESREESTVPAAEKSGRAAGLAAGVVARSQSRRGTEWREAGEKPRQAVRRQPSVFFRLREYSDVHASISGVARRQPVGEARPPSRHAA